MDFELNDDGTIKTCPLLSCRTVSVAETAILLQLRYVESPSELASGGRVLQTVMPPAAALALAADLSALANGILSQKPKTTN